MTHAKLDKVFHENPKVVAMSDKAFRLYVCSITYSFGHRLLNGRLSPGQVLVLRTLTSAGPPVVDELLKLNAWEIDGDGFRIHDYEKYNGSNGLAKIRSASGRIGGQKKAENSSKPLANRWQNPSKIDSTHAHTTHAHTCAQGLAVLTNHSTKEAKPDSAPRESTPPNHSAEPDSESAGYPPRGDVDELLRLRECSEREIVLAWEEFASRSNRPSSFPTALRMANYLCKIAQGIRSGIHPLTNGGAQPPPPIPPNPLDEEKERAAAENRRLMQDCVNRGLPIPPELMPDWMKEEEDDEFIQLN